MHRTFSPPSTTVYALAEAAATPEEEELQRKKARLVELEAELADRELDLASLRSDLIHFEKRYLDTVGRRYAILDDLKAQIAEARARKNPKRDEAREQARQARTKAEESARAAGVTDPAAATPANASSTEPPVQSDTLRKLYRKAAKLIHPDQTLNADEKQKRHELWPNSTQPTRAATRNASARSSATGRPRPRACRATAPAQNRAITGPFGRLPLSIY